jgi:hypothetical protein
MLNRSISALNLSFHLTACYLIFMHVSADPAPSDALHSIGNGSLPEDRQARYRECSSSSGSQCTAALLPSPARRQPPHG